MLSRTGRTTWCRVAPSMDNAGLQPWRTEPIAEKNVLDPRVMAVGSMFLR